MQSKSSVIAENLRRVRARIASAASRAGRDPDGIMLLPVTKAVGADEIRILRDLGVQSIGESRVMDAWRKSQTFAGEGLDWHLVGHLQRNKVRKALDLFSYIHSVDSVHLARALSDELVRRERSLPCLVEVNTSREPQKYGFSPQELMDAVEEIASLAGLRIEGLMTMAMLAGDGEEARPCFALLGELFRKLGARSIPNVCMKHLSMGMTQDFEIAVEEGATIVRVGTALFEGIDHA